MPVFEYKCSKCGKISEFLENSSSKKARFCAHCGNKEITKQISTFSPMVKEGQSKRCNSCTDHSCPHAGN